MLKSYIDLLIERFVADNCHPAKFENLRWEWRQTESAGVVTVHVYHDDNRAPIHGYPEFPKGGRLFRVPTDTEFKTIPHRKMQLAGIGKAL